MLFENAGCVVKSDEVEELLKEVDSEEYSVVELLEEKLDGLM